ncbi:MAG TPA: polysaccharide deacetylase family protein [bacterium]|nr:polysaccharide deacetylase family protein [bacterium]
MTRGLRARLLTAAGLLAAPITYTVGAQFVGGTLERGVIKRGPRRPQVALTFDDGPDSVETPRILEALAEAKARAAFFLVGRRVDAAPGIARAIAAAGHDLGNHTYSHRHFWTLGPRASREEVDRGASAIADATGQSPRYFRPPWGTFNWTAYARAGQIGETRVLWSVRPEGWLAPAPAGRMTAFVVGRAHPGAIVDLHDRGGHPSTPAETCAALPGMIAGLRDRGFEVVPLRELLGPVP